MTTRKEFQETNVTKQGDDAHDERDKISKQISGISSQPASELYYTETDCSVNTRDYYECDFSVDTRDFDFSVITSSTVNNNIEPSVSISKSVPFALESEDTVISSDSENNSSDENANPPSRNSFRRRGAILICLTLVFMIGSALFFMTDIMTAKNEKLHEPDALSAKPSYYPTRMESSKPSTIPTSTPTSQPTSSPTVEPTLTTSPTSSPTMTSIPSVSPTTTLLPSASPSIIAGHIDSTEISQSMAYSLMMNQADMKNLTKVDRQSAYNGTMTVYEKIMQRFSMLAVWFSLSENKEMPPNLDECEWPFVECEDGMVKKLHMARQNFTGSISETIENLSSLRYIDLAENQIQGSIPEQLYSLTGLEHLYLNDNRLTGNLTESVGNLSDLKKLNLCHNDLHGTIPDTIKLAERLELISLCHNKFQGTLPSKLRLRELRYLDFGFNKLRGSIPDDMFYKCNTMKWLYLDHNKLTGQIPEETVTAGGRRLETLDLGYNRFTGSFPSPLKWAEGNRRILALYIRKNSLKHKLPQTICNMSTFEYGNLVQLEADCKICTCDIFCEWCWEGMDDDDYDYEY